MKVVYAAEVDALKILFSDAAIEESDEDKPRTILDYDAEGNIVGIEILDASKRMPNPCSIEHVVMELRGARTASPVVQWIATPPSVLGTRNSLRVLADELSDDLIAEVLNFAEFLQLKQQRQPSAEG